MKNQIKNKIILASTSPFRKALLERLNLQFEALSPDFNEDEYKNKGLNSIELTQKLALGKAKSLTLKHPNSILIGSDQVLDLDGVIFGKPKTKEKALHQLQQMSGKPHKLVTSMAVVFGDIVHLHTDITTLWMRQLSDDEILRYIETDHPLDCAGSYKIEKQGIALFDKIETEDSNSIVGLPIIALTKILRQLGVSLP